MFSKHVTLIGENCLKTLQTSSVLITGMGGLGCTVAQMLARTGIGELHIADSDKVALSNLNRQILFDSNDIGRYKVDAAYEKLKKIAPNITVFPIKDNVTENFSLLSKINCIADCTDNYSSRIILDRIAENLGIYLVHAGVNEFYGQITTVFHKKTPSFKEIFPQNLSDSGEVFPPLVTVIGSLQAGEIVKLLCGKKENLLNKILICDLRFNSMEICEITPIYKTNKYAGNN